MGRSANESGWFGELISVGEGVEARGIQGISKQNLRTAVAEAVAECGTEWWVADS